VRADAIERALARATGDAPRRLAQAQAELRCGTSCGSCLPRLRQMAESAAASSGVGAPVA
jgi:assimilatory nitrate reductase catalytic subunit